jgi:hypothetical protein
MRPARTTIAPLIVLSLAGACALGSPPDSSGSGASAMSPEPSAASVSPSESAAPVMFDDFSYTDRAAMTANGWTLRTVAGWPGLPGATWSEEAISLEDDPALAGNTLLQLTATTDGTREGTTQAQVCHERKYRDGTSATRIHFTNAPTTGPDGDNVIESFYSITPYDEPLDPDYSELDFEYLPNGGWGQDGPTLWVNSWETVRIEPWLADNSEDTRTGDTEGWHTLVVQADGSSTSYFIDGERIATHGEHFYPESAMSINYNLWFFAAEFNGSAEPRTYSDQIDWIYHAAGQVLSSAEVEAAVAGMRASDVSFQDTVPDWSPPLDSPCDL